MAYTATIIPIMIATPGDVSEERKVITEVIHDWNDVNADYAKALLIPVGWQSHSSPEMGKRPQEIINTQLLDKCDLLIAVFWTRLGTPTGEAASGTVEEIEKHVNAGKPAMIYFSDKPASPSTIDEKQYAKVQEFKEKCNKWGLYAQFDNIEMFRKILSKQLQIKIINNEYLQKEIKSYGLPTNHETNVFEEKTNFFENDLSEDHKIMLKTAAHGNGTILKIQNLVEQHFQISGHSLGSQDKKYFAKWENVLEQLISNGYVSEKGYKGQVFELTHKGWDYAGSIGDGYDHA